MKMIQFLSLEVFIMITMNVFAQSFILHHNPPSHNHHHFAAVPSQVHKPEFGHLGGFRCDHRLLGVSLFSTSKGEEEEDSIESLWSLEEDDDDDDDDIDLLSELQLDMDDNGDDDFDDDDDDDFDLLSELELDTPPPSPTPTPKTKPKSVPEPSLTPSISSKKEEKLYIDNEDDENDENDVQEESLPKKRKKKNKYLDELSNSLPASNQTVGVGRHGYNMTTLQAVQYQTQKYFPLNEYITYRIRLDFLKDYYLEHGDINVPFRYTVTTYDYDPNGKRVEAYDISLGRWLHNLRQRYRTNKEKIALELREELDDMGMNWDGVGAGRRPSMFRKRCGELKKFVKEHRHDRVPLEHSGGHRALGLWVERQRVLYRKIIKEHGGESESALQEFVSSSSAQDKQSSTERIELLKHAGFNFKALSEQNSAQQIIFDKEWNRMFDLLQGFKAKHGHLDVQIEKDESDRGALLCWASEQKYQVELLRGSSVLGSSTTLKSLFTPKRLQLLTELGFDLSWRQNTPVPWIDIARVKFNCGRVMKLLRIHCAEYGACEISLDHALSTQNPDLLMLYTFQQRMRWENRHENIRDKVAGIEWLLEREDLNLAERLNALGFSWYDDIEKSDSTLEIEKEYEWWEMYHDFKRYGRVNGDFDLSSDGMWYSEELLDWKQEQTIDYLKISDKVNDVEGKPSISEFQYRALRTIGFDLENTQSQELIPNAAGRRPAVLGLEFNLDDEVDDLPQDLQGLAGTSDGQRINKAEQLAWLVRYAALRRFYTKDGPGSLSDASPDDDDAQRLIMWANNQRKQYNNYVRNKKTTMTKRRKELLDEINFDWKLQRPGGQDEWKKMRSDLLDFRAKYGHCFVPAVYPLNVRLGKWVLLQRELYKQSRRDSNDAILLPNTLSKEKEKDLLTIGLDLTMDNLSFGRMAYDVMWMCRLEELAAFKELHGHCNVAIDYESQYYDLGVWVREQRVLFMRNREGIPSHLDKRRIDDLEQLGFSWENETVNQSS